MSDELEEIEQTARREIASLEPKWSDTTRAAAGIVALAALVSAARGGAPVSNNDRYTLALGLYIVSHWMFWSLGG